MSDPASDKPSQPPEPNALPAPDIDAALSQAANLANLLAQEVGAAPGGTASSRPGSPLLEGEVRDADAIDAQLAQIEKCLSQTQSAVTDSHESALQNVVVAPRGSTLDTDAANPPTPAGPQPAGGRVIDLGKKKAPTSPPEPEPRAPEASREPKADHPDFGDLGDAANLPSLDDTALPSLEPEALKKPVPAHRGGAPAARRRSAAGVFCTVLEAFDVPFRWVPDAAREWVGWVALLILFGALVVFVLSFRP